MSAPHLAWTVVDCKTWYVNNRNDCMSLMPSQSCMRRYTPVLIKHCLEQHGRPTTAAPQPDTTSAPQDTDVAADGGPCEEYALDEKLVRAF